MQIALIGDIHLYTLSVHPRRLLSKRVFAHTNLLMNRRHRFNHGLLPTLIDKAISLKPDLALFSGDVTTSSLENEFEDLLRYVKPLTDEVPAVLVPGNHDRYTFKSRRAKRIETLLSQIMPDEFPHTRQLTEGWQLLALDSAIPNRVFSRGALGERQYAKALERIDAMKAGQGLLVLCHYPCALPPRTPKAWSHDMKEEVGLRNALANCKARVVYLHGHIHKPWHITPSDDGKPPFECVNAGSPCYTSDRYPLGQGFCSLTLPDDPDAPLDLTHLVPTSNGRAVAAPDDIEWVALHDL